MEEKKRILSIDALRGFDMMWIIGVGSFLIAAGRAAGGTWGNAIADQMEHVPWEGLHLIDLIFPTFLFLAGASWPFSLASQRAKGYSDRRIFGRIVKRFLILVALGLIYDNIFKFDWAKCLYNSVLGRVGFGWAVAAATLLFCRRLRTVIWVSVGIFAAYWLASLLIPLAVNPPGVCPWAPREVAVTRILDNKLFDGLAALFGGDFQNVRRQGLFAGIGCISSAFLGMYAGLILKHDGWAPERKSGLLALFSIALAAAGGVAMLTGCPCVKPSWNPTYILVAGAIAMGFLALFHWIIDVKGYTKWCFAFQVIGMNSITVYLFHRLFDLKYTSRRFLLGFANMVPEPWFDAVIAFGVPVICWIFVYYLYRKKIFLRV